MTEEHFLTDQGLARCPNCSAMSYPTMLRRPEDDLDAPWERPEVALPRGVRFEEQPDGLEIRVLWLSARALIDAAVIAVVVFVLVPMLFVDDSVLAQVGLPAVLHWLLGLVGLTFLYTGVARLINRTRFTVTRGILRVAHGPLWWPGKRRLASASIDQLYVREHVRVVTRRRKMGITHQRVRHEIHTWEVWLRRKDGETMKLLGRLGDSKQALYVEQRIERFLGIVDRPVEGAMNT